MEKRSKKKASAVAIATAAIMILAGTIAYLADASGVLRNQWDPNHVEVDIAETGIEKDAGKKDYTITPGEADAKDPKITVDTDTDAYVFAIVTDNINHSVAGTEYVDYDIADGWIELDTSDLTSKTVQKYLKTFKDHKTAGELTINPKAANTKVYYRVVHGTNTDHTFGPYSVLKDDQIHYPSTLTNADLEKLADLTNEQKQLIFSTYAIQMEPFCDRAETDETKIEAGAKDAWNQVEKVSKITVTAAGGATEVVETMTLQMSAAVEPSTAKDTSVTWSVEPGTGSATITDEGLLTGGIAGTVTVVATANDGSGVKGTYEVTVTVKPHNILWQVQLHSYDSDTNTATFWPAMTAPANYGPHEHDGACICDYTWKQIVDGTHDFSNCHCTKTVTIDANSNPEIFDISAFGEGTELTSGLLYSSLKSDARKWDKNGSNNPETASYKDTLAAMKNAWDITGVAVSNFDLLSKTDAETVEQSKRIVYNESGYADYWWLATPLYSSSACSVGGDGGVGDGVVYSYNNGIAPGFSISAN